MKKSLLLNSLILAGLIATAQIAVAAEPDVTMLAPSRYSIHADDGTVRPTKVWNDGKNTYIEFPAETKDFPALFVLGLKNGDAGLELINYVVDKTATATCLLVPLVLNAAVLRTSAGSVLINRI